MLYVAFAVESFAKQDHDSLECAVDFKQLEAVTLSYALGNDHRRTKVVLSQFHLLQKLT
jgi:hypothetical protein